MASEILPTEAEIRRLVPTPESIVWRRMGDARLMVGAGYALTLQIAHPTVGAGVVEYSDFRSDPWGRLMRTMDYVSILVYGGPELAAKTARRVREFHKDIKGTRPDGVRYHALEPEAYAWVQATLAEAAFAGHERFGRPLTYAQKVAFWREWRGLSRLVGVRERDLPATYDEFIAYRDDMIANRLVRTEAVDIVLETLGNPVGPPVPVLGGALWPLARRPAAHVVELATFGLLGPALRERFGIPWSRRRDVELRALGAASRATTPALPQSVRVLGPQLLRLRARQIARGDVAGPKSAENARRHAAARAA